jgi:hypothetical protein
LDSLPGPDEKMGENADSWSHLSAFGTDSVPSPDNLPISERRRSPFQKTRV